MPATRERLISVVSTAADMAADPKTGMKEATPKLTARRTAMVGFVALATYFAGQRAANPDHD